jgi:glycosyltransferase involved in cell wall biosynthesis
MSLSEMPTLDAPGHSPNQGVTRTQGRRIRVVFVIDNMQLGGTELNAVRTAERLDRERFELSVVCLGGDGPLTERYRAMGVRVEKLPLRSFYGPSMLSSGWRFVRFLRRERPDIVHAHDVYSNIFVTVWSPMARVPVVITSRRWWTSLPNWKLKVGSRFAVRRSSAVLANSEAVAGLVATESRIAREKIWTITNFADENAFGVVSDEDRNRIRRGWNAPDGAVVIGCVARLDPVKDHASLLRAFAKARSRYPQTFLVLIGDGGCRTSLEDLAQELRIQDALHFAGEVRNIGNLHRGLDISVLSSLSEGFPNTLVEAMAAGRPVIATAVGGSIDAVVDGETGFLVAPGTPDALADALSRLVASPDLRRSFGENGLRRASELYRAPVVLESLEDMYSELVASASR